MKILIIGAAGMVGSKLTAHLIAAGKIDDQSITQLLLADIVEPSISDAAQTSAIEIQTRAVDMTQAGIAEALVADEPDLIYHLAAIVSGEAEADFDKGYRINLDGTRYLLDAIRARHDNNGYTPKFVFTSSIAVYGAPFPESIDDEFHLTPMTSYGTQKAICELLLADCNRRGIVQGIGLRLPTICIRPGKPNLAASGFFSNILREPINGKTAVLPVEDTVRHWFASPRTAIRFLVKAASINAEELGPRCNINLPGLCATVAQQIEALERVVGADAVKLIKREPDETIRAIVANWPENFDAQRAISLGFEAESSFDEIIQVYLEDEMSS
ncbi:D-erythronate dehydrogenase [Granulosicoccus antarcticus]|uniref:GDP-6-deoxy-D-mannose reductase n=1 Tax=Granulosicoccus antarcticus IMCC3135 TaxID=1192854 RepID=A0A2Z2NJ64_9GAMM|nr:D-erythronate dehydrogenase [Granulosicoccus antarcticus]ASJ71209.1 GDP-6-deoxy-D-mannose reductase [Granulosicoccus antarcticus IMCC3135]